MTDHQKKLVHKALDSFRHIHKVHHGDCVGADAEFHEISRALGIAVHIHPPTKNGKRAFCAHADIVRPVQDYLKRNRDIVDSCSVLLAAPNADKEKLRSGTWATVRYARKLGKKIFILLPAGEIIVEN
jgi:hypothetical protein